MYSHLMKRIQLLRPINLHMRNILRRKRNVEEVFLVSVGHLVLVTASPLVAFFLALAVS